MSTRFVACEFCQAEGWRSLQGFQVWEEIDDGPCPECHGACVLEVPVEPMTLADFDAMHDGESPLEQAG